jgi:hypothetical protein
MHSAQLHRTSCKNRKFLQFKPSGKYTNSYNSPSQSRLAAVSILSIGFIPSLQNQRPGVEAGKSQNGAYAPP